MGKIKMTVENDVKFSEGCDEYILDCKARNLRGAPFGITPIQQSRL